MLARTGSSPTTSTHSSALRRRFFSHFPQRHRVATPSATLSHPNFSGVSHYLAQNILTPRCTMTPPLPGHVIALPRQAMQPPRPRPSARGLLESAFTPYVGFGVLMISKLGTNVILKRYVTAISPMKDSKS